MNWTRPSAAVLPWLILLGVLGVRVWSSQTSGLMYDEPVTLHLARSVAAGQLPFVDFYEHHSPLPWYALAPIATSSLWQVQRLIIAVIGVLGLAGLYWLARSAWGARAGLITLTLGAVAPLWNRQGNMIIHDAFLVVAVIGALMAWWLALQRPSFSRWLLAGIAAGLVLLCKQTGILSVLAMIAGLLYFVRSFRATVAYFAGIVLISLPLLFLYWGQYESLFDGLLGWNLAANSLLPANAKLKPFFNDIFWSHPLLWTAGGVAGLLAFRHARRDYEPGDGRPLAAVAGLTVVLVLVFNWVLSKQTFGQYYLQAVPPLALLGGQSLDWLAGRKIPVVGQAGLGLLVVYLGILNPLMNSLTPWTPDLEEKLAIAAWLDEEVEEESIWEPWVYYAHLAGKEFTFEYPFLSIHSMQNDPRLPFVTGEKNIPLESYLENEQISWIVVHDPLLPGLNTRLNQILTAGIDDWQLIRSFQVTRYASENGYQRSLWTPWWKPIVFFENVAVWQRHPRPRQGGIAGDLTIYNPSGKRYLSLEVFHPGGADVYRLDQDSRIGEAYVLRWHQTGHSFFLGDDYQLELHISEPEHLAQLMIFISFTDDPNTPDRDVYQVRLPGDGNGRFYPELAETWRCLGVVSRPDGCEQVDISDIVELTGTVYMPLPSGSDEK